MLKPIFVAFFLLASLSAHAKDPLTGTYCFASANCQGQPLPISGATMVACENYLGRIAVKNRLQAINGSWANRNVCYDVYAEASSVEQAPRNDRGNRNSKRKGSPARGRSPGRSGGCAPGYYVDPTNPNQCRPDIVDGRYRNGSGQVCRNEPDTQGGYVWVCR